MSTNWKSRLGKLETLLKGSGNRAFQIATELRELWKDKEFLADACEGKIDVADSKLSKFSDATGYHLNELLQMIEHFPNQADWKDGHIRHLYDETCKAIASRRKSGTDDSEVKPARRRVSVAEYELLEREKQEADRRAKEAEKAIKAKDAEIKRLQEENRILLDKIPKPPRAA